MKKRMFALVLALLLAGQMGSALAATDTQVEIVQAIPAPSATPTSTPVIVAQADEVIGYGELDNVDGFLMSGPCIMFYVGDGGDITTPANAETVNVAVFAGNTSIHSVTFTENITYIDPGVCTGCNNLKSVTFLNKNVRIAGSTDMFWGSTDPENWRSAERYDLGVTIYCWPGSTAETWAKEHGYKVSLLGDAQDTSDQPTPTEQPTPTTQPTAQPTTQPTTQPTPTTTQQPSGGAATQRFADVAPGAWYYEAVNNMAHGGLLLGYDDGLFHPDDEITVGQFAMILARAAGLDTTPKEGAHWATGALNSIGNKAVFMRNDDQADELVNRGEAITAMVTMARYMMKYATTDKTQAAGPSETDMHFKISNQPAYLKQVTEKVWTFDDLPDIARVREGGPTEPFHGWSAKHILLAYNLGIVEGTDANGTCAPDMILTRAQVCQLLYRMGISSEGSVTISGIIGFGG